MARTANTPAAEPRIGLTCTPAPGRGAPSTARDAARLLLANAAELLGDRIDEETADTVVLVVSELVTNVVRHAGGRWRLDVAVERTGILVGVTDGSCREPRPRPAGEDGGWGWGLVGALAESVEVVCHEGGKTVRARIRRPGPLRPLGQLGPPAAPPSAALPSDAPHRGRRLAA